jgi:uncharacterized protein
MTKTMVWAIKPTKFCNLRCAYCYEWNELANPERMSPELLRRVLEGVRDQHEALERRYDRVVSTIAWHGGEPLALPLDYLRDIMHIEADVFGTRVSKTGAYRNVVQTNLYRLTEPLLDFLDEAQWAPGVSLDVVPGLRVARSGRTTEEQVLANVQRLRERGFDPMAIMVLARHTAPRIREVYDFFVDNGFSRLRVLPLFAGPAERNAASFAVPNDTLAEAMCILFAHWLETGAQIEVEPLSEYFHNVLRRRVGYRGRLYDRAVDGECVLTVNTNGDVYLMLDAYEPALALGNLGSQSMQQILESPVARQSLQRDEALRARTCEPCAYAGFCSGWPAFEAQRDSQEDRCSIAYRVHKFIDDYLDGLGVTGAALAPMLRDVVAQRRAVALPVIQA